MKRLKLFLTILVGLSGSALLVEEAVGHGTQTGSRTLVSSSTHCQYPSTTVLTETYETEYTVQGIASAKPVPEVHVHTSTITAYLRPYMSNYDSSCNDYIEVCDEVKYYTDTCHRGDEDCNIFGNMGSDGVDVRGAWLHYWRWIKENCRQELVL